jgi:hypothetical protein
VQNQAQTKASLDVDSFFAFSDTTVSEGVDSDQDPDKQVGMEEKREKILSIYSKMARLEAFLNHTK